MEFNIVDAARAEARRAAAHPHCVVCGPGNPWGLRLEFTLAEDGSVHAQFAGTPFLEGYTGMLHGGVIAALLDGAMTNCLFALGSEAVTAELRVRYRHPVSAREPGIVRAWRVESCARLHRMAAELTQRGCVKAAATATFMERP